MSRGQGRGRVRRVRRNGQWIYIGDWTDANGQRHREVLGRDRETADRIMIEKLRRRDRTKAGLSAEMGQDRLLAHLASEYVSELATRCTPKHVRMMETQLAKLRCEVHAQRRAHVVDVARGVGGKFAVGQSVEGFALEGEVVLEVIVGRGPRRL